MFETDWILYLRFLSYDKNDFYLIINYDYYNHATFEISLNE